ncbi:MAG: hypothetical protein OXR68_08415, partial [Alphaproteobacteria bacterium]|nr:hypothetical protein [Alphaproteobacteria bacterium]
QYLVILIRILPPHRPVSLNIYQGNPIWHKFIKSSKEKPVVLLGVDGRFSVWDIVHVEVKLGFGYFKSSLFD